MNIEKRAQNRVYYMDYECNIVSLNYRFPWAHVPHGAIEVLVALLLGGVLRAQPLEASGVVHHRGDATGYELLALDLAGLLASFATLLGARAPFTRDPLGWTWVLVAGLSVVRFKLKVAEALVHHLVVTASHALDDP